jgi:YVTN family beta-propeller protein
MRGGGWSIRGGRRAGLAAFVVMVWLTGAAAAAVPSVSTGAAANSASLGCNTALVTNEDSGTVTPIDLGTLRAGPAIPVGVSPVGIAITPDGTRAVVTNDEGLDGTVTIIDLTTGVAGPTIAAGSSPASVAITPDGSTALVTDADSDSVTPIDLTTDRAESPIAVDGFALRVAITPDGSTALVTETAYPPKIVPIDLATREVGAGMVLPGHPFGVAVTPDGSTALVADENGTITSLSLPSLAVTRTTPIGSAGSELAVSPDGTPALKSGLGGVTPFDPTTGAVGSLIAVPHAPWGLAVAPDGRRALVAQAQGSSVTPLDLATNTAGTPIPVENGPAEIAITPDQAPVAVIAAQPGTPSQPTSFDASRSTARCSPIATYQWDFGDGSPQQITTGPTVAHQYTSTGRFVASVTETTTAGTSTQQVFTGQTMSRNGSAGATASTTVAITAAPLSPAAPTNATPEFTG